MFGEAERQGFQPVIPADWAYRSIFSIPDEFFGWGFFLDGESKIVDGQRKHYQNHQFFQNVEQKIREYFYPDPRVREWILKSSEEMWSGSFASVHVRRGDYLKHSDFFPALTSGYYRSAIRDVRERKPGIHIPGTISIKTFCAGTAYSIDHSILRGGRQATNKNQGNSK